MGLSCAYGGGESSHKRDVTEHWPRHAEKQVQQCGAKEWGTPHPTWGVHRLATCMAAVGVAHQPAMENIVKQALGRWKISTVKTMHELFSVLVHAVHSFHPVFFSSSRGARRRPLISSLLTSLLSSRPPRPTFILGPGAVCKQLQQREVRRSLALGDL